MKDVLVQNFTADAEFDQLFNVERVAELQSISEKIKAGGPSYTISEVELHFQDRRAAWLATHKS